jgi:hypothetical protein
MEGMYRLYSKFWSVGTTGGQWPKNSLIRPVKGPASSVSQSVSQPVSQPASQYIDYGPGSKIRQRQEIFLFSTGPRLAVKPTRWFFREVQRLGPEVAHTHHLQPRMGMSGAIHLLCTGKTLLPHTPHLDDSTLMRTFKAYSGERA